MNKLVRLVLQWLGLSKKGQDDESFDYGECDDKRCGCHD